MAVFRGNVGPAITMEVRMRMLVLGLLCVLTLGCAPLPELADERLVSGGSEGREVRQPGFVIRTAVIASNEPPVIGRCSRRSGGGVELDLLNPGSLEARCSVQCSVPVGRPGAGPLPVASLPPTPLVTDLPAGARHYQADSAVEPVGAIRMMLSCRAAEEFRPR